MEIIEKKVPEEFLAKIPDGVKYVRKNGKELLVFESVTCRNGHNLVTDTVKIHNENAIRLTVKYKKSSGDLYVASIWGNHAKLYSFADGSPLEKHEVIDVLCPVCGESLIQEIKCDAEFCNSEYMVEMILPDRRSRILACAEIGCPAHYFDTDKVQDNVIEAVNEINYFGESFDDFFMGE